MSDPIVVMSEDMRFDSLSDFKCSLERGAEICFIWENKMYAIDGASAKGIVFSEGCYEKDGKYYNAQSHTEYDPNDEVVFDSVDKLLQQSLNGELLRDVILKAEITECSL